MPKKTPQPPPWAKQTPPAAPPPADEDASWEDLPEFDSLGDLLRAAPLLPLPPAEHLARLNRMALARATAQPRWRLWLARCGEAIASTWYSPMGHRFSLASGAVALLLLGLWLGGTVNRPAATPEPAQRWVSLPSSTLGSEPPNSPHIVAAIPDRAELLDQEFGVESPLQRRSLEHPEATTVSVAPRLSDQMRENPTPENPFPSVYVMPGENAPSWQSLSGLGDQSGTDRLTSGLSLTEPLASLGAARAAESDELADAAQAVIDEDLLGALRRFKLDMYLSGDTEEIPRVQRIEEVLSQLLESQSQTVPQGDNVDLETQRRFAEAEQHLLNRDFRRAEDAFNDIAHEHSGTRLAALCWYHLGDIYYDFHGDFPGARQCYSRALDDEGEVEEIFPAETLTRLRHRLALLDDASGRRSYEPLRLLRQAEAAPAGESLGHYRRLLLEHASSEAVGDGISSLAERAMLEIAGEPNFPHDAISLLRQYQSVPGATQTTLAQLRLADIIYNRLHDYPQALIEYGQIRMDEAPPEMESMIRDRIAEILDSRVSQR